MDPRKGSSRIPGPWAFLLAVLLPSAALPSLLRAAPLSRGSSVDFFSEVRSRDLAGLATRSDGRLVAGPALTELTGSLDAELLWTLEPEAGGRWLVGTGPDGRILEAEVGASAGTFSAREIAHLDDPQVFAVRRLPDGSILAGTSPRGGLVLIRDGRVVARTGLPSDSVFDLILSGPGVALAAAGNPGRIYRIDLARFAAAGLSAGRTATVPDLAARGITVIGDIRDRNVRRMVRLGDGRIAVGSAPKGNVYVFGADGGAPFLLQENTGCEVTDLLDDGAGGFYAAIIHSASGARLSPTSPKAAAGGSVGAGPGAGAAGAPGADSPSAADTAGDPHVDRFGGRSTVVWFPRDGYPETLVDQAGMAIYRLGRSGELLLMAGGDQGELAGYDRVQRTLLRFSGSSSGQLNGLEPLDGSGAGTESGAESKTGTGRWLALRNNPAGFALLDWTDGRSRSAQTRALDLGGPARLGALRLDDVRGLGDGRLSVWVSTGNASDESEGWSPWLPMHRDADEGWRASPPLGRYVRLRLGVAGNTSVAGDGSAPGGLEIGPATVFFLPQDHRPHLEDFHLLPPNFALVPPAAGSPSTRMTVGQLIQADDRDGDDARRTIGPGTSVIPSPGTRAAYWSVTDADGDNLLYTFSIRRDGESAWTDLALNSPDSFVQFDTGHMAEGRYDTRLVAAETAPRPAQERLSITVPTDDLIVDHTPPVILEATARRDGDLLRISVHGSDPRSLLAGIEVAFNNGLDRIVEHPQDGILDGRDKTFVLEVTAAQAAGATSAEVTLQDDAGNTASQRVTIGR